MKKESLRWLTGSAPLCSEPFWWVLRLGLHLWRSDIFSSEQLYTHCPCLLCIILYLYPSSSCFLCLLSRSLCLFLITLSYTLPHFFSFFVCSFPLPISLIILSFFPASSVFVQWFQNVFETLTASPMFYSLPTHPPPSFHLFYTQDVSQYSYHHLSLPLWLFPFLPLFSSTPLVHHCRLYRQGSSAQSYVEALLLFGIFSSATVFALHAVFCQTRSHQFNFLLSSVS